MRYARGVSESFVDLAYRGLPLGRRIKLSEIRPSTGYLELPAPMPVGTKIAIATDEGVAIDAVVARVHEQVGGSEQTPGMTVVPALAEAAAAAWWKERVALPELEPPAEPKPRTVLVRPRPKTIEPPPAAPAERRAEEPAKTIQMEAVPEAAAEPAAAEPASAEGDAEGDAGDEEAAAIDPSLLEEISGPEAEAPLEDDGKKTVMMHSIDLSALGLEAGASGQLAAVADDGGDGEAEGEEVEIEIETDAAPASDGGDPRQPVVPPDRKKPHGKKRKKRR